MNLAVYQFDPHELEETLNILNTAISYHRHWFDRLHTAMLCEQPFPQDILHEAAHTRCDFGKWYYGEINAKIHSLREFSELEEVHRTMHDNARQLANFSLQDTSLPVEDYQRFLKNQNKLIDLLNTLYKTLIEHRYSFDTLTGANNRRTLSLLIEQSFENVRRYKLTYSVAMIDADNFKQVNDKYGHIVGDQVLKHISIFIRKTLRKSDFIGRYGGEEFLILLPETDQQTAYKVMENCRKGLCQQKINIGKVSINISVSIGVSQVRQDDEDAWIAVKRADFSLYKAKESGRNLVVMSETQESA